MVVVQTKQDPVAARADLQAFRHDPAHDGKGPQSAQVFQHTVADLDPAPWLPIGQLNGSLGTTPGRPFHREHRGLAFVEPGTDDRFIRVPLDSDLHMIHSATAVAVGHSQRDGVEARLFEGVRRRVLCGSGTVTEIPGCRRICFAAKRYSQRWNTLGRRRRDLCFRTQLFAGRIGREAVGQIRLGRRDRVLTGRRGTEWHRGHFPGIDKIHFIRSVPSQRDAPRSRIRAIQQIVLAPLCQQITTLFVTQRLQFIKGRRFGHEIFQPLDPPRALAVQHAPLGPPEDVIRMLVGFAMADVTTAHRSQPKPLGHGLRIEIAPALWDIALIPALVENHRLLILCTISNPPGHVGRLQTGVRDPVSRMVVPDPTVVNAAQAAVRVFVLQDLKEPIPVVHLLVASMALGSIGHEIKLVSQRPPDVTIGRKPGDAIPQIPIVLRVAHVGKAPTVVGVPEDQVGLDAQPLQVHDALLEVVPESRIGTVEVELAVGLLAKRKELRFVLIVGIRLGEHAEANLVERRSGQSP